MECEEITQPATALHIIQNQDENRLDKLFHCIYALFQTSFLNWIAVKYGSSIYKQKIWEDAKDAFQNGVMMFYIKAQQKEFKIAGSLKTTIYSFGLLQLLAVFKKEKKLYQPIEYIECLELFFLDEALENERQQLLNEKENDLAKALTQLTKKQRDILLMKFFEKLKSKEIAEKLHVSSGNVDNDAAKAYKELRNILKSKYSFQI